MTIQPNQPIVDGSTVPAGSGCSYLQESEELFY